jgi:orotate phosphoribosyltransferase
VHALRDAGCVVAGLAAIFTYGFEKADESFKEAKCPYFTLSNYPALISYAAEHQMIKPEDLKLLEDWRINPETWGK